MNIVRLNNLWNVHYIAAILPNFKVMDFQIIRQTKETPLLPEGFNAISKEYIELIIAEDEVQRIALWVQLLPEERMKLRQFIMSVYEDVSFEVV